MIICMPLNDFDVPVENLRKSRWFGFSLPKQASESTKLYIYRLRCSKIYIAIYLGRFLLANAYILSIIRYILVWKFEIRQCIVEIYSHSRNQCINGLHCIHKDSITTNDTMKLQTIRRKISCRTLKITVCSIQISIKYRTKN
jgi:hypothetical protein